MKIDSTHKNLNTSYVNLSALLKFLRRENFIGSVHFETKGYEADIFFTKENEIQARENDHFAGRISVGSEVLSHILIRAHEPDGIINVFDEEEEIEKSAVKIYEEVSEIQIEDQNPIEIETEEVLEATIAEVQETIEETKPVSLKEKLGLPSLPFSFRKKSAKAKKEKNKISEEISENAAEEIPEPPTQEKPSDDWNELLEIVGELLQTVENSLAEANLNFVWVFDKVRTEIFEDYPFLHPNSTVFAYNNGKVSMSEQINNNLFVASIAESLRRLLEKFETHPKFAEVHRSIILNMIELMNKRHAQYDKYLISQQLEKVLEL